MAFVSGDRVLETTTTIGTGNITLAGAVAGYRAFSALATVDGDQFPYVIAAGSEWEVGVGTRLSSTTFARTLQTASSNGGAAVNFSAGTKQVWMDDSAAMTDIAGAKNLVVNGALHINQQQATSFNVTGTTTPVYQQDCFCYFATTTANVTISDAADAPPGFAHSFKVAVTGADASIAATDNAIVRTDIVGYDVQNLNWGTGNASNVALSFATKHHRTGIWTGSINNNAYNRALTFEYTQNVADTWEFKSVIIPGDTTGTWDTTFNAGLRIQWALMVGSNFQQAAGSWGATGAYGTANQVNGVGATSDIFQLGAVSLVHGSVPLTASRQRRSRTLWTPDLLASMRFFQKTFPYGTAPAQNVGINTGEHSWFAIKAGAVSQRGAQLRFRVPMRTSPSANTFYNPSAANSQVRDVDAAADCTGTTGVTASENHVVPSFTGNAATAVGNLMCVHHTADSRFF